MPPRYCGGSKESRVSPAPPACRGCVRAGGSGPPWRPPPSRRRCWGSRLTWRGTMARPMEYHRCPVGSVCFFSEPNGTGEMCSWTGDDPNWLMKEAFRSRSPSANNLLSRRSIVGCASRHHSATRNSITPVSGQSTPGRSQCHVEGRYQHGPRGARRTMWRAARYAWTSTFTKRMPSPAGTATSLSINNRLTVARLSSPAMSAGQVSALTVAAMDVSFTPRAPRRRLRPANSSRNAGTPAWSRYGVGGHFSTQWTSGYHPEPAADRPRPRRSPPQPTRAADLRSARMSRAVTGKKVSGLCGGFGDLWWFVSVVVEVVELVLYAGGVVVAALFLVQL